jgi:hypothetical protein
VAPPGKQAATEKTNINLRYLEGLHRSTRLIFYESLCPKKQSSENEKEKGSEQPMIKK